MSPPLFLRPRCPPFPFILFLAVSPFFPPLPTPPSLFYLRASLLQHPAHSDALVDPSLVSHHKTDDVFRRLLKHMGMQLPTLKQRVGQTPPAGGWRAQVPYDRRGWRLSPERAADTSNWTTLDLTKGAKVREGSRAAKPPSRHFVTVRSALGVISTDFADYDDPTHTRTRTHARPHTRTHARPHARMCCR